MVRDDGGVTFYLCCIYKVSLLSLENGLRYHCVFGSDFFTLVLVCIPKKQGFIHNDITDTIWSLLNNFVERV